MSAPNNIVAASAVLGCNVGMTLSLPQEKPLRRCLLPGCGKMHRHNGGYCCAEHCREHRGRIRKDKEVSR